MFSNPPQSSSNNSNYKKEKGLPLKPKYGANKPNPYSSWSHNMQNSNFSTKPKDQTETEADTLSLSSQRSATGFINEPMSQWPAWSVPAQQGPVMHGRSLIPSLKPESGYNQTYSNANQFPRRYLYSRGPIWQPLQQGLQRGFQRQNQPQPQQQQQTVHQRYSLRSQRN